MITSTTPPWEQQYLRVLKEIHENGYWKETRQLDPLTGDRLKTRSIDGATFYIRPNEPHPILTIRPMARAFRMFVGEEMWKDSGDNTKALLHKYGIMYWDEWATEAMCERSGVEEGTLGRSYGPETRSYFGFDGIPVDQLKMLISNLRYQPFDKRMIVSAYHPADHNRWNDKGLVEPAIPVRPCHGTFHFQWEGPETDVLHMTCFQWSADLPLGLPSNLAMYRVLFEVICKIVGRKMGNFTYHTMDVHYYSNQIAGVEKILTREPRPTPTITISDAVVEAFRRIIDDDVREPLACPGLNPYNMPYLKWLMREITIEGYDPHPAIPRKELPVAV